MEGHHVWLMSSLEVSLVEVTFVRHRVIRMEVALQIFRRILGVLGSALCRTRMAIVIVGWNAISIGHVQLDLNVTNPALASLVSVLTRSRQSLPQRCS